MIGTLIFLSLAAQPPPALPPPHAVLVAPSARRALEVGQKIAKESLDVAVLEAMGVALDQPAYVYGVADTLVLELALTSAERFDTTIDLGIAQRRGKKLTAAEGERAAELYIDKRRVFVLRTGKTLYLTGELQEWPSTAIAAARVARKPNAPPKWVAENPVVYFEARGIDGLERLDGALHMNGSKIDFEARAMLDFTTGLLAGDLASSPGKSAVLIDRTDAAIELTAFLPRATLSNFLELEKLGINYLPYMTGRLQANLTKAGKILVAVESPPETKKDAQTSMESMLEKKYPGIDVSVVTQKEGRPERGSYEARAKPNQVLAALEALSKSKGELRPKRLEVAWAKSNADGVLSRLTDLQANLSFGPGSAIFKSTLTLK